MPGAMKIVTGQSLKCGGMDNPDVITQTDYAGGFLFGSLSTPVLEEWSFAFPGSRSSVALLSRLRIRSSVGCSHFHSLSHWNIPAPILPDRLDWLFMFSLQSSLFWSFSNASYINCLFLCFNGFSLLVHKDSLC